MIDVLKVGHLRGKGGWWGVRVLCVMSYGLYRIINVGGLRFWWGWILIGVSSLRVGRFQFQFLIFGH
jgi:hypothetical protein